MRYRALGRTGWKVSEISFGAWAIGGSWGQVSDEDSMAALHKAIDCGVNSSIPLMSTEAVAASA
jgi:aryl-alcohol dehydrogenase-like predicted oxidoreductase